MSKKELVEKLNKELENKSTHDKLTGVYNREYFETHYKLIINDYTKEGNLVFLSILDIDFFKKVKTEIEKLCPD